MWHEVNLLATKTDCRFKNHPTLHVSTSSTDRTHISISRMSINHQPTDNPSTATAVIPTSVTVSTKDSIPFSQCNEEMIQALEACERKKADEEINKKRKVTPTKQAIQEPTYSLPKCSHCHMEECHEIKFSGYCLSKVYVYCDDKENAKSLDWHMVSFIYKEAYKEIWRVCTYLQMDFYDPSEATLDLPYCMSSGSYLEAEELVKCKLALNRVSLRFWDGAMKKVHDEY